MASESRNTRKKARTRRNLSQARRALQEQTQARVQAHATLLMVLSQAGGEVTVSQATMQTVLQGLKLLNWVTEAKTDGAGNIIQGEFIVRVVTQEGVQAVVDEAIAAAPMQLENGSTVDFSKPTDAEDLMGVLTPEQQAEIQQELDFLDAAVLDAAPVV